jgi:hypothetical protein
MEPDQRIAAVPRVKASLEMAPYVKFMQGLDHSDEARRHVAWQTAAELFKIDVSKLGG